MNGSKSPTNGMDARTVTGYNFSAFSVETPIGWTQVDRSEMAAVTALRGDGGTFPSRTQKSDPQGRRQERVEGAHTERVLLHARSLCRAVCVERPKPVRAEQTAFTEVPSFRALVNVCATGTQPNRQSSLRNTSYLRDKGERAKP